ncbi:MAG: HlyD family efflux transporter periplasmic adaptor subunit [Rhodospirillaceae bacterium]
MTAAVRAGVPGFAPDPDPDPDPDAWLARPLPCPREDIALLPAPAEADGTPTWTIYDPVRHRYFRFGRAGFEFLSRWAAGTGAALLKEITDCTTLETSAEELDDFIRFLRANTLLRCDEPDSVKHLATIALRAKPSWATWLLHNYLFIRIPLFRPDHFLNLTLPRVEALLSRRFIMVVLIMGGGGLVLALRQWDQFLHTFQHFFSVEGALAFTVTLAGVKACHELGHAWTAKHFGCRVPTMGVALMVLCPVLYTDVSDAWRLVSRRPRLLIGAAGILTELSLALIATFLWSFLPDGPVRSAAFLVATTTWITSLAINLSPFMRFDGYYLLADWLGVSNLQPRSFALACWHLRRLLFGFDDPPPELFPRRQRVILIIYAWMTWLYRLTLFAGIAFMVYHFFIKVLGIFLFAVEVGWFIALPVFHEILEWVKRRRDMHWNRASLRTALGAGFLLWLTITPWQSRVEVPAVLRAANYVTVFSPSPARIVEMNVANGQTVAAGAVLYRLEAPDLAFRLRSAGDRQRTLEIQIERHAGSSEALDNLNVLREQLAAILSSRADLARLIARLTLRAPFAGVVNDLPPELHLGLWVRADQPLGTIIGPEIAELRGFVAAPDVGRIVPGARGRFLPDDPSQPALAVEVTEVARVNAATLDVPMLASIQGGPIAVQAIGKSGSLVPTTAVYRIALQPLSPEPAPIRVTPGIVQVEGEARSLFARVGRTVAAILIRESGF